MGKQLIKIHDINLTINNKNILKNINLEVKESDFITIIGPNGSGKTSLMKIIIDAQKPTSGKIIKDKNLQIGYVPQNIEISNTMPIDVKYFLHLNQKFNQIFFQQIIQDLQIDTLLNKQLINLSGGQKQRILLAKALLSKPNLLILDEPAQNLDISGQLDFYNYINKLNKEKNIAILMISHDLHIVMSSTNKVICLYNHICCQGAPEIISKNPDFKNIFGADMDKLMSVYNHYHNHHHG